MHHSERRRSRIFPGLGCTVRDQQRLAVCLGKDRRANFTLNQNLRLVYLIKINPEIHSFVTLETAAGSGDTHVVSEGNHLPSIATFLPSMYPVSERPRRNPRPIVHHSIIDCQCPLWVIGILQRMSALPPKADIGALSRNVPRFAGAA
jgi:hypothetical protein